MSDELETLGAASSGAIVTRQSADLVGSPCRNCGTLVTKRYCTNCGQLAASFHRPVWSLLGETISDSLALDGRVARSLPLLFFRPGRLTRNYTTGKRARYVPPFRLLLLASLLFYLVLFAMIGQADWWKDIHFTANESGVAVDVDQADSLEDFVGQDGKVDREKASEFLERNSPDETQRAIIDRGLDIVEDPRLFLAGLERWAPRLSLLLIPSTIFVIALLHFWRRRMYIYDHAVHALHLHAWLFLTGTIMLFAVPLGGGWVLASYSVYTLVYIGRSFVVVGQTNIWMAGMRTVLLLVYWLVSIITMTGIAMVLSGMAA